MFPTHEPVKFEIEVKDKLVDTICDGNAKPFPSTYTFSSYVPLLNAGKVKLIEVSLEFIIVALTPPIWTAGTTTPLFVNPYP